MHSWFKVTYDSTTYQSTGEIPTGTDAWLHALGRKKVDWSVSTINTGPRMYRVNKRNFI